MGNTIEQGVALEVSISYNYQVLLISNDLSCIFCRRLLENICHGKRDKLLLVCLEQEHPKTLLLSVT